MNYMSMICLDELSLSETKQEECDAKPVPLERRLKLRGQTPAPNPPRPPSTKVRVRNAEALVTDGPFAETREHLGG